MSYYQAAIGLSIIVGFFVIWVCSVFWPRALPVMEKTGEIGIRHREISKKSAFFRTCYPLIRQLAAVIALLPGRAQRKKTAQKLKAACHPYGLTGDEFFALSILCGAIGGSGGIGLMNLGLGHPMAGLVIGMVVGCVAPKFRLDDYHYKRIFQIGRGLPQAIDLIALAMQAGLDFSGAIKQVSTRLAPENKIRFELELILHKLSLGESRRMALVGFSKRVNTAQVKQFVQAVLQAEKQGTPLAEVLSIQANVMRRQRSEMAEQAAAKAGILLMGPLMLIFICVFIIILGPFVVKSIRGELF